MFEGQEANGLWTLELSHQSLNYREMLAVILAIRSFSDSIRGRVVQLLCDNVPTVAYINHLGGPSSPLSNLVQSLWVQCHNLQVTLTTRHLPGIDNQQADRLSRLVAVTSSAVEIHRQNVRPTLGGSLCLYYFNSATAVQQSVSRPKYKWCRCPCTTKLGSTCEFCKLPISPDSPIFRHYTKSRSRGYFNCSLLARTTLVQASATDVFGASLENSNESCATPVFHKTRTTKKLEMEDYGLARLWEDHLITKGWSDKARKYFILSLAPSTVKQYDSVISKFYSFCCINNVDFIPLETSVVADFLCSIADNSSRPMSQISIATAALSHLYSVCGLSNIINDVDVKRLCTALLKGRTEDPRVPTPIMPVESFCKLFSGCPIMRCWILRVY